jgi:hypothetical protein
LGPAGWLQLGEVLIAQQEEGAKIKSWCTAVARGSVPFGPMAKDTQSFYQLFKLSTYFYIELQHSEN